MSLLVLLRKNGITGVLEDSFTTSDQPEFAVIPFNNTIYSCAPLPPIQLLQLIGSGQNSYARSLFNSNFLIFTTNSIPNQIVGTYTTTIFNSEVESQGNQPKFANKTEANICAFNPTIHYFDNNFMLAWLENDSSGKLNLKFGDTPVSTELNPQDNIQESLYIRPYVTETLGKGFESFIPLNKITIVDAVNDNFDLSTHEYLKRGFNIQLNAPVKSIQFIQTFKIDNATVNALLTMVPIQGSNSVLNPLVGAVVNIYAGKTAQSLVSRSFTDELGKFSITLPYAGEYLFEIEVSNNNIFYQQQIL